jgi:WD40 repeat protein
VQLSLWSPNTCLVLHSLLPSIFAKTVLSVAPGLDSKIIVWDVEGGPSKKIVFERANVGGIAAVKFLSAGKFASAGADCSVKVWVI